MSFYMLEHNAGTVEDGEFLYPYDLMDTIRSEKKKTCRDSY